MKYRFLRNGTPPSPPLVDLKNNNKMPQPKGKPSNNRKKKPLPKHPLSWFVSRIGKVIYRNDAGQFSVKVDSEIHAKALEMYQNDLNLFYRDTPFTHPDTNVKK